MFSGNTFGINTIFNRDISAWDVSNVTNMRQMFYKNIAFNQNLSLWGITQVANFIDFMPDVRLSTSNYDALLIGWDAQGAMSYSGTVDFGSSQYTSGGAAEAARTSLIAKWGGINDGGPVSVPLILRVKTDNVGASNDDQFTLQVKNGIGYNYDIEYDGQTLTGLTTDNDVTLTFPSGAGSYDIRISGIFPALFLQQSPDKSKLIEVKQWGNTNFGGTTSIQSAFAYNNLLTTVSATDVPVGPFTNLQGMFGFCSSLVSIPNLNNWDVSNITSMGAMFREASNFNGDMSSWNTSNVTDMSYMFSNVPLFNGDISSWDVSSVTNFKWFLYNKSSWNNDLSSWDVSSATNMERMFQSCTIFNSDIGNWNVSGVTNMFIMFQGCTSFDQDLSSWQISQVTNLQQFMTDVTLSTPNYDALLIAWDAQGAMSYSGTVDFGNSQYTPGGAAEAARTSLIAKWGGIIDGGAVPVPFTISVKTDNVGTSNSDQFTIPWTGTYDVDWGDGNTDTSVVNAQTHTYATAGTYDVSVTAASGKIVFANVGDKLKLLDIKSWGDTAWTSMLNAFYGCTNLDVLSATDTPDLSVCLSMQAIFRDCTSFNTNLNEWDVSNINSMKHAFYNNYAYNQPMDNWDVSNVRSFYATFSLCIVLNQDLNGWVTTSLVDDLYTTFSDNRAMNQSFSNWDVSRVSNFYRCFYNCDVFNQDMSAWDMSSATNLTAMFFFCGVFNSSVANWDLSNVTFMTDMFRSCTAFNQPLSSWTLNTTTPVTAASMFRFATNFNQDITGWNTSQFSSMNSMFLGATNFDQDISGWTVTQVTSLVSFGVGITLSTPNYDALLIGWDAQGAMTFSGTVNFGNSQYTSGGAAEAARTSLINSGWTITDGGAVPVPYTTNLVASYSFDTDFSDYTGNNPLTANGNATAGVTGGKVSDCAELDGSDDYTVAADSSDFSFTNNANDLPFSFSFWANFDTVPGLNALVVPFSKTTYEGIEYIFSYVNGELYMNLYSQSLQNVSISAKFSFLPVVGDWNHIAITYDGSSVFSGIKPYINSVSIPTTSNNEGSYLYMVDTPSSLNIGSQGWIPTEGEFDGKLDEFHIWKNRELTQSEVTDIYNTENAGNSILPLQIPLQNIISEYKFEDNALDTVGTNNGTATDLTYASGLVGKTGVFNGTTSDVQIADTNELSFGNGTSDIPFSISLLIRFDSLGAPQIIEKRNGIREYQIAYDSGNFDFRLFDDSSGGSLFRRYVITPSIGVWYSVIATYDASSSLSGVKLYFDGIEVGTTTGGNYTAMENGTSPVYIGKYFDGVANSVDGNIDCVRFWNKELTQTEITEIATAELNGIDINP